MTGIFPTVTTNPCIPRKFAKPLPTIVTTVPPVIEPDEGVTEAINKGIFEAAKLGRYAM